MTQRRTRERRRWTRWYPKKRDDNVIGRWAEACSRSHRDCADCELAAECQDLADRLIACMCVASPFGPGNRVHPVRSSPDTWSADTWFVAESDGDDRRKKKECRTAR